MIARRSRDRATRGDYSLSGPHRSGRARIRAARTSIDWLFLAVLEAVATISHGTNMKIGQTRARGHP